VRADDEGLRSRALPRHRIPVRPEARPRAKGRNVPPVLVADPDPAVRASTVLLIRSLGYEAFEAARPADVLDAVEREAPGLVLLETQFPGLNVSGLVAALRSHHATSGIPIAFFSASKELPQQASRHRAWGTLAKPFAPRELALLLGRALGPPAATPPAPAAFPPAREARAAFRELRNLLAALENYLALVQAERDLPPGAREAAGQAEGLAATLEAKLDHLRAYVLSLLD